MALNMTRKEMCQIVAQYLKEVEGIDVVWRVVSNYDKNSQYGSLFSLYTKAEKYFN